MSEDGEPKGKGRRLFVGIGLDDAVRERCATVAQKIRLAGFDARYEAPEKYHLTLAFLGNVAEARIAQVEQTLDELAETEVMRVTFDRLGGFPHERRPRVVFIGAREQGRAFRELASRARERYASLGFKLEKDPVAHVTIARVKAPQRPLPSIEVEPIPIEITALSLFESLPDPAHNTTRYEVRRATALAVPT